MAWRKDGVDFEPGVVQTRLKNVFAPLFPETQPLTHSFDLASSAAAMLELPIVGWSDPHIEQAAGRWALAAQYPTTLRAEINRLQKSPADAGAGESGPLSSFARLADRDPAPFVESLNPPFFVAWGDPETDTLRLLNDGLGFAQAFVYDDGKTWAISNRLMAFQALGVPLEPVPEEWAARLTLDWFPLDRTGYKNIRFLSPATFVSLKKGQVAFKRFEAMAKWLRPEKLSPVECLELSHAGFQRTLREVTPRVKNSLCGLTGGWDSRCVASGFIREGVRPDYFRVRGAQDSEDVVLAKELAETAGLDLIVKQNFAGEPPTAEELKRNIQRALLWQGGYIDIRQHDGFQHRVHQLDAGDVNFMGQHGEIGRGFYYSRIAAAHHPEHEYESRMIDYQLHRNTPGHYLMREGMFEGIRELFLESFHQADAFLEDPVDKLDFYYLYERTRRWASAGNNIQPGVIVTPFLTPEYIHAVYNYPAAERVFNPFHRHIIAVNYSKWLDIPFQKSCGPFFEATPIPSVWDRMTKHSASKPAAAPAPPPRDPQTRMPLTRKWRVHGLSLIQERLERGGFWTTLIDPDRARQWWAYAPEQFIVAALLDEVIAGDVSQS